MTKFGKLIREKRSGLWLSQKELATSLSVHPQTIFAWEKGESIPSAKMVEKIAEKLEISVDDLLKSLRENENDS